MTLITALIQGVQADVVRVKGKCGYCNCPGNIHETWYVGSNEKALRYNKNAPGAFVEDGLFVAMPDGGPYSGYTYYELRHPSIGKRDGGPAYLPPNPQVFPPSGDYKIASGGSAYGYQAQVIDPVGNSIVFDSKNGGPISELPDQTIIPIGSKFFFWVSGAGSYNMGPEFVHQIRSEKVVVKVQAIPEEGQEIWFEPSDVVEETLTLLLE